METISVYIDTNIIHDFFLNLMKAVESDQKLVLPKQLRFLIEKQKKGEIKIMTSLLTQAEIARRLKSEFGFEEVAHPLSLGGVMQELEGCRFCF